MSNRGFTLIEIMIALVVFATIAMIASSVLYQTLRVREGMQSQLAQLNSMQTTFLLAQQDITELVPRAVRGNEMHLFPAFIGQPTYVEFTRGGAVNPMSLEQRSTLERVAYRCQNVTAPPAPSSRGLTAGSTVLDTSLDPAVKPREDGYIDNPGQLRQNNRLIRRVWSTLDTPDRQDYHDAVLLENLSKCSFAYLNTNQQLVPTWYQDLSMMVKLEPNQLPIPKAIQFNLTDSTFGNLTWFFIIPSMTYDY